MTGMCNTRRVMRISSKWMVLAGLVVTVGACKKDETVVPQDDTWVPDESLEPAARAPDPAPGLTEDERKDKAKDLYIAAEGKAGEGDWAAAVGLYEQAYQLVPGKHGFAHKVGIATWKVGNCDKTKEYLTHFVTYAEGDKYAEKIAEAQAILDEIEATQCATPPEPEPVVVEVVETPPPAPVRAPAPAPVPVAAPAKQLPKTASAMPLIGLAGLSALGLGGALRTIRTLRRR